MGDSPKRDRTEAGSRWVGRPWLLVAVLLVVAAACSETGAGSDSADDAVTSTVEDRDSSRTAAESTSETQESGAESTTTDPGPAEDGSEVEQTAVEVPLLESGRTVPADLAGPGVELVTIQEEPFIGAAVYPRPDYEGNPWSQWGQGIALDDGRVITAIGDHLGADANSYLFVYDPEARTLTRFADVLSALDHEKGSWGYGKIHSQMVDAGDGGIYFTTYYGSRRGLSFDGTYQGDVLFRLDKATLDLQPVVIPVPRHGVPSLATDGNGLVYGEAVDPLLDDDTYPAGGFFVFDTAAGEILRFHEDPRHQVFRNIMVAENGTAWYAAEGESLFRYDPDSDRVEQSGIELAGPLRASTAPAGDGTIFGVTLEPYNLFAFDPDGEVRPLGQAVQYAASLALLPDESGVLYVPGAHGDSWEYESPLIAVDTETGEQTRIVELLEPIRDAFELTLGGTYSITIDPDRGHAHIGFNAGPTEDSPWGEVVFVVVELP